VDKNLTRLLISHSKVLTCHPLSSRSSRKAKATWCMTSLQFRTTMALSVSVTTQHSVWIMRQGNGTISMILVVPQSRRAQTVLPPRKLSRMLPTVCSIGSETRNHLLIALSQYRSTHFSSNQTLHLKRGCRNTRKQNKERKDVD
jgi:hypothetical protein